MRVPWAERPATYTSAIFGSLVPLWLVLAPFGALMALLSAPLRLSRRKPGAPATPVFEGPVWPARGRPRGVAVCVHGWPDGPEMWKELGERLCSAGFEVHALCIPGFDGSPVGAGWDLQRLVEALARRVEAVGEPVALFLHDFGCILGLKLAEERPDLVRAIIALDVGRALQPRGPELIGIAAYQTFLAFSFWLGGRAGDVIVRPFARSVGYEGRPVAEIKASMGYPYRYLVSRYVRGTASEFLGPMTEHPPLFYAYGTRKMLMFHGPEFVARLEEDPRCDVLELDCGHWILLSKLEEVWTATLGWLPQALEEEGAH